jgi:hypothetical protein
MSRDELRALTERLAPRQAAQTERLTHQRRGGLRHPGARSGVFPQKISNAERVLLTILHLRGLCTLDVFAAALGDVSRSAIGGVIRETRPLLERHHRFQDCAGAAGEQAVCAGITEFPTASGGRFDLGGIAVLDLHTLTVGHEVPVTVLSPDGHAVTRNPVLLETDGPLLRMWAAPDDGDEPGGTTLLVLETPLG